MFVTLVAFLIREQRWKSLRDVLDELIPMHFISNRGPGNVSWEYASKHLPLLMEESTKTQRISVHADLLHKRHAEGGALATALPFHEFMDADFFLFLLSRVFPDKTEFWRAWSRLYLRYLPAFVRNSERTTVAEKVAETLALSNVNEFKKLLAEGGPSLSHLFSRGWWNYPIAQAEIDRIATR